MPRAELHISLAQQQLELRCGGETLARYPISSGAAGVGFAEGSGCTPTGNFRICSRHGENAPLHTCFRGRIPRSTAGEGSDLILARILCLDGLDPANANTRARYIYIHGTADTARLGTPASHGCIRMAPCDIAELYPHCPIGTPVRID